jgi:hypothetical protein
MGKPVDALDVFHCHAIRRLIEMVGIKFSIATIDVHSSPFPLKKHDNCLKLATNAVDSA